MLNDVNIVYSHSICHCMAPLLSRIKTYATWAYYG